MTVITSPHQTMHLIVKSSMSESVLRNHTLTYPFDDLTIKL